ncbi:MAG: hypothetical protein JOZ54_19885 [Acidobacteria bacterium]|nr:hypothetical protein [Acidobacteriota bacterium]
MADDPVVAEIHKIRAELLEQYGGLDGYLRHLEDVQRELQSRIVTREPRRPSALARKVS